VFLFFGVSLGLVGVGLLIVATARAGPVDVPAAILLAAIALTMRLNTFTIPPRIEVSLIYTVQLAAVVLVGGAMAGWISVGTFLLALTARRTVGVSPRVFLAVVSFNVGMESLMALAAGEAYRLAGGGGTGSSASFLLTPAGLVSVLTLAVALKAVNETLMIIGSYLRGVGVGDYLSGARRVLAVEAGMLPLGLLLALVGGATGARGLAVAALVLFFTSVLVKRVSDTRDELQRINLDLERRVGELDVLGRVGRAISSTIEIDDVLDAIHRHCSEVVSTDNFFVALLDREAGELEIALHTEAGQRLPRQRIRLGEGLTSLVIQRREPVLIHDLDREAAGLPVKPIQATPLPTRSWLGVPLIAGDEVLGVMTVQDERPSLYDENTVRLLTTIAAQAAISVKNALLVRQTVDQARLEQENRDLRLVNQRKNEFVNMVAHQLQAPLTAIMGFSDLVRRRSGGPPGRPVESHQSASGPGESAEHLEMIHRESQRLSHLVEQLLSLSRIRSGRITPKRRRVDLNTIAREVIDAQFPLIRDSGVEMDVDLSSAGLPVEADPTLLHQAVANLVNNAVKYSPAGSRVMIRTGLQSATTGSAGSAGAQAVLSVHDSGPGITREDRERIFEEFYRSSTPGTQHVKGSGLGLTIAREIVRIHEGRISVDESPAGGSVFSFHLPAAS
jgi:signal transduction histidine kinase